MRKKREKYKRREKDKGKEKDSLNEKERRKRKIVGERTVDGLKDRRKENNRWIEGQNMIRRKAFRKTKGK